MVTRRNLLKATATGLPLAVGGLARWPSPTLGQTAAKTFVLAHGSWHGGWCWKRVAEQLRAKGHVVYTRPRRRRAAEQRDKLAPSNVTCHAPLPRRHAQSNNITSLFDHSRQLRAGRDTFA